MVLSYAEIIIETTKLRPLTSHTITNPDLFWQELRSTAKRGFAFDNQESARNLAKEVDIMIIVGGKNSSNTKQLYNISKEYCQDCYLVEDYQELQKEWFSSKKLCGVSAGASTPNWIIDKIVQTIQKY